jgi:WD40 repeat protein
MTRLNSGIATAYPWPMQKTPALARPLRVGKSFQLRFTGDGDNVIAVGRDVVLWSVSQKKRLCSAHPFAHPGHMDISPSGAHAVIKNTSGQLVVLSIDSLEVVVAVPFDQASEGCNPMYSPCGTQIIDGSWDGLLRLLDSATGKVVHQELSAGVMIRSIACDPERMLFAYVKQPKVADRVSRPPFSSVVTRRWPFVDHPEVEIPVGDHYVYVVSLSPDGNRLAVLQMNSSAEFSLQVIELSGGSTVACRGVDPGGTNRSLAWSRDGSRVCCLEKGQLSVFDSTSLEYVARHVDAYPCYVEYSPDGSRIAIGSREKGAVLPIDQLEQLG